MEKKEDHKDKLQFESHLQKWKESGGYGERIDLDSIDDKNLKSIISEIFSAIKKSDSSDSISPYKVYLSILNKYGIMCPHPTHLRLYSGREMLSNQTRSYTHKWFSCKMCDCRVINPFFDNEQQATNKKKD